MAKPVTPEELVPGSQQGAEQKPEDTVAGPDGNSTTTDAYKLRQLLAEQGKDEKRPEYDPSSPEGVAAGGSGKPEDEGEQPADNGDSDADEDEEADEDDEDAADEDEEADEDRN